MVEDKELKEIEESEEHRLYRLRKGTRSWREVSNVWVVGLLVIAVVSVAGPLLTAWAVHDYPPDSTNHYVKTGELNKSAASIIDRIVTSQTTSYQWTLPFFILALGLGVGALVLFQVRPDKKDIAIFDDALELYATGKLKDNYPKFCPECGTDLKRRD
jgi:H+/Cl- antiporter ClcA